MQVEKKTFFFTQNSEVFLSKRCVFRRVHKNETITQSFCLARKTDTTCKFWYNCTIICDLLFLRLLKRFFNLGLGVGLGLGIVLGLGLGTGLALGLRVGWVLCITARSYSN